MKKILYVDDSSLAQQYMGRMLEGLGELSFCTTLKAGQERLQSEAFDLLIADYLFPEGDALPFLRMVRKMHPIEKLPVIVVSGSMDRLLVSEVFRAGANDAFPKPLHLEEFRGAVEKMLKSPYVRHEEEVSIGVRCLQWFAEGRYYQYSPDRGFIASAETKEAVAAQMHAALVASAAKGETLGCISRESIVTHVISRR